MTNKKILFLAPQPFFETRGTPIAVKMLCEVLCKNYTISVICYPIGEPIDGINLIRCYAPEWITKSGVKPGASFKKLVIDIFFFYSALKALSKEKFDLVHGIEEGGVIALILKMIFNQPYIYDMDSKLADSLIDKWPFLRPIRRCLSYFENKAIIESKAVIVMCESLRQEVLKLRADGVYLLQDIPQQLCQDECADQSRERVYGLISNAEDLDVDFKFSKDNIQSEVLFCYVGNLEHYQGIDLMLQAFIKACEDHDFKKRARLVIVGGDRESIANYQKTYLKSSSDIENGLNGVSVVSPKINFVGARPLDDLGWILRGSDVLVSPRIAGTNTPMKLYSYVEARKAILATNLPTHTQVLSHNTALLVAPDSESFASGFRESLSESRREDLSSAVQQIRLPDYDTFVKTVNIAYSSAIEG